MNSNFKKLLTVLSLFVCAGSFDQLKAPAPAAPGGGGVRGWWRRRTEGVCSFPECPNLMIPRTDADREDSFSNWSPFCDTHRCKEASTRQTGTEEPQAIQCVLSLVSNPNGGEGFVAHNPLPSGIAHSFVGRGLMETRIPELCRYGYCPAKVVEGQPEFCDAHRCTLLQGAPETSDGPRCWRSNGHRHGPCAFNKNDYLASRWDSCGVRTCPQILSKAYCERTDANWSPFCYQDRCTEEATEKDGKDTSVDFLGHELSGRRCKLQVGHTVVVQHIYTTDAYNAVETTCDQVGCTNDVPPRPEGACVPGQQKDPNAPITWSRYCSQHRCNEPESETDPSKKCVLWDQHDVVPEMSDDQINAIAHVHTRGDFEKRFKSGAPKTSPNSKASETGARGGPGGGGGRGRRGKLKADLGEGALQAAEAPITDTTAQGAGIAAAA